MIITAKALDLMALLHISFTVGELGNTTMFRQPKNGIYNRIILKTAGSPSKNLPTVPLRCFRDITYMKRLVPFEQNDCASAHEKTKGPKKHAPDPGKSILPSGP
jgi:hypothetical protein